VAHLTKGRAEVNARIVFWGIAGAGVSTNLRMIHDKLRADHRGELRSVPTALDPATHYEVLPIELGQVNGLRTRLQVLGVPGGSESRATRKQLLDRVDGVVFIVDSQPDRLDDNLQSLAELRESLGAYGRALEDLPLVVEYNKRDLSDPYTIEELHRRLAIPEAAVFEAVAPRGTGVLQTLTTISKRVVRVLRDSEFGPPPAEAAPVAAAAEPAPQLTPEPAPELRPEPAAEPEAAPALEPPTQAAALMEEAILTEGEGVDAGTDRAAFEAERALDASLDRPWEAVAEELKDVEGARIGADFDVVSVGTATKVGTRGVRVPLVLGNPAGETVTLSLTVQLDPLLDETDG